MAGARARASPAGISCERNLAGAGPAGLNKAAACFLLLPYPDPVGLVVLDRVVLGAGFGQLSTPLQVRVQSTVTWRDRGAVISALLGGQLHGVAEDYLPNATYVATQHIYVGMVIVALATLAVVLLPPRHFPEAAEASPP